MQTNQPYDLNLLWEASNFGLSYFHEVYSDSVGKENKNKHFSTHKENTPSTTLSNKKSGNGVYSIYNHASKEGLNAIDHVIKEQNLTFLEACEFLFQKYGLSKNTTTFFKPEIKWQNEHDKPAGFYNIEYSKKIENYQGFAPFLTPEICKEYDFYGINSYTKVTETGKLITTIATKDYPIFGYKFKNFVKIYEPKAPKEDKYLNKHHYFGSVPKDLKFGWERIFNEVDWQQIDDLLEQKKLTTSYTEKRKLQERINDLKLDCVVMATGGSDGLNLASLGYNVIWFNSEAVIISSNDYLRLKKIAKIIYYVPDLDTTGVKQAVTLGLKYIDVKILWLPETLKKDGKKDFRDWVWKLKNEPLEKVQNIFKKMLSQALNFQFWDISEKKKPSLNPKKLLHFLEHQNFRLYKQPFTNADTGKEDEGYFVQIENNLIKKVFASNIKKSVNKWLDDNFHKIDVYNMILRSPFFNQNSLKSLPEYDHKKNNCGIDFQYYFFNNKAVKITKEAIQLVDYSKNLNVNIWENEKIAHYLDITKPYFETNIDDQQRQRIKILDNSSNYLKVLINTSRIFWQKETDLTGKDINNFNINGENLESEENYLQELHLQNKMYCVGYALHQYKIASKAWMLLGVDYAMGATTHGSYGGTGKSFLQKALFSMFDAISIGGKTLKDDNFPMDGITPKKKFVLFDDLQKIQPIEYFYNMITDNFVANQKGGVKYNIPFEDSAKVGATTNFAPEMNSSTQRRLLVYYNSDYYHVKTDDNDYSFSRKISDDFNGKDILTREYPVKEWNCDYNFMLQCLQFYLQQTTKIEAPLGTLVSKNAMQQVGKAHFDYFNEYFEDAENLNKWIEIKPAVIIQKEELGVKAVASMQFTQKLILYCKGRNWGFERGKVKNDSGNSVMHFIVSKDKTEIETLPTQIEPEIEDPEIDF